MILSSWRLLTLGRGGSPTLTVARAVNTRLSHALLGRECNAERPVTSTESAGYRLCEKYTYRTIVREWHLFVPTIQGTGLLLYRPGPNASELSLLPQNTPNPDAPRPDRAAIMSHPFIQRLRKGVLLADGAIGTMLYAAGHSFSESLDALNLSDPALVASIHRSYLDAGADVIEANTFSSNRFRLEPHGLADRSRDISRAGVALARKEGETRGAAAFVAGVVGPTGRSLAPLGTLQSREASLGLQEQIECLLEEKPDLLIVETMVDLEEMECAVEVAKAASDLPIVAMMTFGENGRTPLGSGPEEVALHLAELHVEVIGANCSFGPQPLLPVIARMRRAIDTLPDATARPFLACMPNAGPPRIAGSDLVYESSPDDFARFARDAAHAGIRLIGGCCGTTPEHIRRMRLAIDEFNVRSADAGCSLPPADCRPQTEASVRDRRVS